MCASKPISLNHTNVTFGAQLKDFFSRLLSTADWPPRWHCGNWTDFHGWLYIFSDLAIWAAYFAIPLLLFRIINKRKDIPFPKIIWLFIAFILLCGTTHLIDAIIFWWPAYRLSALVRFATAVISIFTVYALFKILPMVYNLRTASQLEAEIEERKKAEAEAQQQLILKQTAEELMSKKDEFMSIASHELKTPITTLKASLQVLEKMSFSNDELGKAAPFIEKASRQVNKLTDIVQELLDVTRIQSGSLQLHKTDFNLMDMVKQCVDECLATGTHAVDIAGDDSIMVHADVNRIDQVLTNLLTNAFKYSPSAMPVSVLVEKTTDGRAKVTVSDKGIGIPEEKIGNIFDRFYRVENTSQNFSGIGLGLYISAEIIKRHDGDIGVSSTPGKGSSFWIVL
jgi:signal transduction histidine kinase